MTVAIRKDNPTPKPTVQTPTAADLIALVNQFDWAAWNERLAGAYAQLYRDLLVSQAERVTGGTTFDVADPFVSRYMSQYVGARIVQLEGTTKREVIELIRESLDSSDGLTPFQLGTQIARLVQAKFADYARFRADRIARTETGFAYNAGGVLGARQAGFTHVDVSDGVEFDPECAAANGSVWTVEYALDHLLEHPNCRRSFSPHVERLRAAAA